MDPTETASEAAPAVGSPAATPVSAPAPTSASTPSAPTLAPTPVSTPAPTPVSTPAPSPGGRPANVAEPASAPAEPAPRPAEPAPRPAERAPVTLGDVVEWQIAMAALSKEPLPVRTSAKILRLVEFTEQACAGFRQERLRLLTQLGTPTVGGSGNFTLTPENLEIFRGRIGEITRRPVTIGEDLVMSVGELEKACLSANDLSKLAFLLSDL